MQIAPIWWIGGEDWLGMICVRLSNSFFGLWDARATKDIDMTAYRAVSITDLTLEEIHYISGGDDGACGDGGSCGSGIPVEQDLVGAMAVADAILPVTPLAQVQRGA